MPTVRGETEDFLPEVKFPDSAEYPNFTTINGEVFLLQRVECNVKQATDAVHKYYALQAEDIRNKANKSMLELTRSNNTQMLQRMQEIQTSSAVQVPPVFVGNSSLMFKVINRKVCPVKTVLYSPTSMSVSKNMLMYNTHEAGTTNAQINALFAGRGTEDMINISFKSPVQMVTQVAFCEQEDKLMVYPRTFHTMTYGDLCTGNTRARDIWALSTTEFLKYFNNINMFSLATRIIDFNSPVDNSRRAVSINEVLNTATDVQLMEVTTWRA